MSFGFFLFDKACGLGHELPSDKSTMRSTVYTVWPGSSDPFYIVIYDLNGSLLPGHIVPGIIRMFGITVSTLWTFCAISYEPGKTLFVYYMPKK